MTMNSIVISDVQHDNVIRAFLFLFAFHVKTVDQSRIYHIKYSNSCHTTIVFCNYFPCVLHSKILCVTFNIIKLATIYLNLHTIIFIV